MYYIFLSVFFEKNYTKIPPIQSFLILVTPIPSLCQHTPSGQLISTSQEISSISAVPRKEVFLLDLFHNSQLYRAAMRLSLNANRFLLFLYFSASILKIFKHLITFSTSTLLDDNSRFFCLSYRVKGFFLERFLGISVLLCRLSKPV